MLSTADGAFPLYVKPLAATHLGVVAPATATNGTPFGITVSALDQYENVDTSYVGTVHLTSTFWSGVTAIFEGIMSYWNEEQGELYIWQLDAHLRRHMRAELDTLQRRLRVPMLLISHDPEDAEAFGDQVLYLDNGRLTSAVG